MAGDVTSEEYMWRAVVGQSIRDMYLGDEKLREEILRWLTTEDFEVVCGMASIPYFDVKKQILNLSQMSSKLSRKYGRILYAQVMGTVLRHGTNDP